MNFQETGMKPARHIRFQNNGVNQTEMRHLNDFVKKGKGFPVKN